MPYFKCSLLPSIFRIVVGGHSLRHLQDTGNLQEDDARWGGEREGGRRGRVWVSMLKHLLNRVKEHKQEGG